MYAAYLWVAELFGYPLSAEALHAWMYAFLGVTTDAWAMTTGTKQLHFDLKQAQQLSAESMGGVGLELVTHLIVYVLQARTVDNQRLLWVWCHWLLLFCSYPAATE